MLEIDEKRLDSLLKDRKSKIDLGKKLPIDGYFAAGVFLFALLTVNYSSIPFLSNTSWLQSVFQIIFWIMFSAYIVYLIIKSIRICKNKYNTNQLKKDLYAIAKKKSKFSLVILKDNKSPSRFLQLYDKRWKCYLFMYFHTVDDEHENTEKLKGYLKDNLGLNDTCSITPRFIFTKTHEKESVPDKIQKVYEHRFYEVEAPEILTKKSKFKIGNRKYKWMTIEDMRLDTAIMQKNEDVIEYINEYYN